MFRLLRLFTIYLSCLSLLGALGSCRGATDKLSSKKNPSIIYLLDPVSSEIESASTQSPAPQGITSPEGTRPLYQRNYQNRNLFGLFRVGGENISEAKEGGDVTFEDCGVDHGNCLVLSGGGGHPLSLRSSPFPALSGKTYRLKYQVRTQDLTAPGGDSSGRVSLQFYKLTSEIKNPKDVLLNLDSERALRIVDQPLHFSTPSLVGTNDWRQADELFTVPEQATHFVFSIDLARCVSDCPLSPTGKAFFDSILLSMDEPDPKVVPLGQGKRTEPVPRIGTDRELRQLGVSLHNPKFSRGKELRESLSGAAPWNRDFSVKVPAHGVLSFGTAINEPLKPCGVPIELSFEVRAKPIGLSEKTIFQRKISSSDKDLTQWVDTKVPLEEFGNSEVVLSFRAGAEDCPGTASVPTFRMVVSDPTISGAGEVGRTVLLVGIDSQLAKRSSLYGYERPTTPQLTRLAKSGTTFTRAISAAPWTLPAFSSMITGKSALLHGGGGRSDDPNIIRTPLGTGVKTVTEILAEHGWQTRGWANNRFLLPQFGFTQGFRAFVDYEQLGAVSDRSHQAVDTLIEVLENPVSHDRFLFFHMMDPHAPYTPNAHFHKQFVTRAQDWTIRGIPIEKTAGAIMNGKVSFSHDEQLALLEYYEAAVANADDELGRIVDKVLQLPPEKVMMIVTSDHGEEFFEHGKYEHGHSVFDELLHVPLVVAGGSIARDRRDDTPVSTESIAATILHFAGVDPGELGVAAEPLPGMGGTGDDRELLSTATLYGPERFALEKSRLKYIYTSLRSSGYGDRSLLPPPHHELYDLRTDPEEQKNLVAERPDEVRRFSQDLLRAVIRGLDGRYFLFLDLPEVGSSVHVVKGSFRMSGEGRWSKHPIELISPVSNSPETNNQLSFSSDSKDNKFSFEFSGNQLLLAISALGESDPEIILELSVDGVAVNPEDIMPRGVALSLPAGRLVVAADRSQLKSEELIRLIDSTDQPPPRLIFGRLAGGGREPSRRTERLPTSVERDLRALGYVSE